jgi:hypothetical protein
VRALTPGRAGVHAHHFGGHAALVDANQAIGPDRVYPLAVAIASGRDLSAILLDRPTCLL